MRNFNKDTHPKTEDGQFACTHCEGKTYLEWPSARNHLGDNPTRTDCIFCNKTGYYVVELLHELKNQENTIIGIQEEVDLLETWIKKSSSCKTCNGNRMKTPGLLRCKECDLDGNCPWGG